MNKKEAIEQLYRLSLDWEENGLDTKLNQTDINAIKIIVSELDIANKKLEDMKEYINYLVIFEPNIGRFNKTIWGEELLSIIDINNKEKLDSLEEE
jgi:hypothetical protein